MEQIKLQARAKINLGLDVLSKLDNGYHSLKMVMQSVNLYDTILIKKSKSNEISLKTNIYWLPKDERNLVYKTAKELKEEFKIKEGIEIVLLKSIPICAGLGGGSADCAATLLGIRNLFKLHISAEELQKRSVNFGADVPFCLMRGTAIAEGIGEILKPLPPIPRCFILICKPQINISTESIFSELNLENKSKEKDIEKLIYYIKKSDLKGICSNMFNILEGVTINKYPYIEEIKQVMLKNNALGSIMTGSGSAVFGIWTNKKEAIKALKELKYIHKIKEIYLTKPFNNYKNY